MLLRHVIMGPSESPSHRCLFWASSRNENNIPNARGSKGLASDSALGMCGHPSWDGGVGKVSFLLSFPFSPLFLPLENVGLTLRHFSCANIDWQTLPHGLRWYFIAVLLCICLIMRDVEHLFMCLLCLHPQGCLRRGVRATGPSQERTGESGAFGLWPHPRGSSRISS